MSVYITITNGPSIKGWSPCLCAQRAECWGDACLDGIAEHHYAELAQHAYAACPFCKGEGVEIREQDEHALNISNGHAAELFGLLGKHIDPYCGSMSVEEAQRLLGAVEGVRCWSLRSELAEFVNLAKKLGCTGIEWS